MKENHQGRKAVNLSSCPKEEEKKTSIDLSMFRSMSRPEVERKRRKCFVSASF